MKLTCCTWDFLLGHGAHSRHITQIGIYFILRNNSHIDVPWNISKIFYWISFFCSTHGFDIELYDILCSILCKLYILRIGVLDWYIHCARVWYEIIKIVEHSFDRYRILFWNFEICTISIKFQGHTGQKITNFDSNWAFLDCNSSLNSPMGLKWCTTLDVVQKRCLIVFRGHPSNFKVTWTAKSMIWIQAKLLVWAQLSNPSVCLFK